MIKTMTFLLATRVGKEKLTLISLLAQMIGRMDECRRVIVQGLKRFLVGVDHVTGLIVMIFNVILEPLRDSQLVHLVPALVKRRGQVKVTAGQKDPEIRIVFHGPG